MPAIPLPILFLEDKLALVLIERNTQNQFKSILVEDLNAMRSCCFYGIIWLRKPTREEQAGLMPGLYPEYRTNIRHAY